MGDHCHDYCGVGAGEGEVRDYAASGAGASGGSARGEVGGGTDAFGACVDGERGLAAAGAEGVAGVPVEEGAGLGKDGGWVVLVGSVRGWDGGWYHLRR